MLKRLIALLIVVSLMSTLGAATVSAAPQKAPPVYVYTDDSFATAHPSYGNLKPFSHFSTFAVSLNKASAAGSTLATSATDGYALAQLASTACPNPQTSAGLANKPVVVTVKVTYTATGSGQFRNELYALVNTPSVPPIAIVKQDSTNPGTISETKTVTFTNLEFKQVFGYSTFNSIVISGGSRAAPGSSASMTATVSQVTFEFV